MKERTSEQERKARAAQQFAEGLIGAHLDMTRAFESSSQKEQRKKYLSTLPQRELPTLFPTLTSTPAQELADSLEELLQQKKL